MMKWDRDFNLQVFLDKLEKVKKINQEGKVSFEGWGCSDIGSIFLSYLTLDKDVAYYAESIVHRALFEAGKKTLTKENFNKALTIQNRHYASLPFNVFYLATEVSINRDESDVQRKIDGVDVYIKNNFPGYIKRKDFIDSHSFGKNIQEVPSNYKKLWARVMARSAGEAGFIALQKVNFLCSIWNYYYNFGRVQYSFGARNPMNRILLGPIHSLHNSDSGLAEDIYYYEYPCHIINFPKKLDQKDKLFQFEKMLRKKLKTNIKREMLEKCFIDYSQSQAVFDLENAILLLWSIIERLMGYLETNHKTIINRISNMYSDYKYHRAILSHIADYRNRYVHANYSRNDSETVMMQLKGYVEDCLDNAVFISSKFKDYEEFKKFCDLTPDMPSLKASRSLLDKRIKRLQRSLNKLN